MLTDKAVRSEAAAIKGRVSQIKSEVESTDSDFDREKLQAVEEGIVPGGGVALLQASSAIKIDAIEDEDEKTGAKIILTTEAIVAEAPEPAGAGGGMGGHGMPDMGGMM